MRSASTQLQDFLFNTQGFVFADLYTITLARGAGVLRWTSADQPVKANGYTFVRGPRISDAGVKQSRGLDVDTVDITFSDEGLTTINGIAALAYIRANGFDAAAIQIERGFAADWASMYATGPVGTYIRFSGRFSQATDGGPVSVKVTAASWLELLNSYVPADVYQAPCANALFDSRCKLARSRYQSSGAVTAPAPTETSFNTDVTPPSAGYYDLGTVVFQTGANAGLTRTIKFMQSTGNISVVAPLPVAPAVGDGFFIYPGCDLTMSTCQTKFDNLLNFRGEPFIPVPETGI